jgi:hypothetical protein
MSQKRILITQSNYIPWKGYFDCIAMTDVFVVYDDMQYTKRDWRNRNKIVTPKGLKWLSIPVEVKGKFFQKINETQVADKSWNQSHWSIIEQNYKNAPYFKEIRDWLKPLYLNCNFSYLTEINLYFIRAILEYLQIQTEIRLSSEFELYENRTQRLVNIVDKLQGTEYYSGSAAKIYIENQKFEEKNIALNYFDYSNYPEYPQLSETFEHGVSIFDLLFNTGDQNRKYLKFIE